MLAHSQNFTPSKLLVEIHTQTNKQSKTGAKNGGPIASGKHTTKWKYASKDWKAGQGWTRQEQNKTIILIKY
jgi:hypothetical protein